MKGVIIIEDDDPEEADSIASKLFSNYIILTRKKETFKVKKPKIIRVKTSKDTLKTLIMSAFPRLNGDDIVIITKSTQNLKNFVERALNGKRPQNIQPDTIITDGESILTTAHVLRKKYYTIAGATLKNLKELEGVLTKNETSPIKKLVHMLI